MATTKKTTKKTTATKKYSAKPKAKENVENTGAVDEFLNSVTGETFTMEDIEDATKKKLEPKQNEAIAEKINQRVDEIAKALKEQGEQEKQEEPEGPIMAPYELDLENVKTIADEELEKKWEEMTKLQNENLDNESNDKPKLRATWADDLEKQNSILTRYANKQVNPDYYKEFNVVTSEEQAPKKEDITPEEIKAEDITPEVVAPKFVTPIRIVKNDMGVSYD